MAAPKEQIWYFLRENIRDAGFNIKHYRLIDFIVEGGTLKICLDLAGKYIDGTLEDVTFWIFSTSIPPAVQLFMGSSIMETWNNCCKEDPHVTSQQSFILSTNLRQTRPEQPVMLKAYVLAQFQLAPLYARQSYALPFVSCLQTGTRPQLIACLKLTKSPSISTETIKNKDFLLSIYQHVFRCEVEFLQKYK